MTGIRKSRVNGNDGKGGGEGEEEKKKKQTTFLTSLSMLVLSQPARQAAVLFNVQPMAKY
jgi:hypothetical protein